MALQISYTDKQGITNSSAYCRISQIEHNLLNSTCTFRVYLYHNSAARSKSDELLRKNPVGGTTYIVYGDDYTTYLADSVLKEANKTTASQLYAWLKQHDDKDEANMPEDVANNTSRNNHGNGINWTTATDG